MNWTLPLYTTWSGMAVDGVINKEEHFVGHFLLLCLMQQQKYSTSWMFLALFTVALTECSLLQENTKARKLIKREQY